MTATPSTKPSHLIKAEVWKIPGRARYARIEAGGLFCIGDAAQLYRFVGVTRNTRTGAEWIDAFELGVQHRSFDPAQLAETIRVKAQTAAEAAQMLDD